MAAYFTMVIIDGKLKYSEVVAKYPQFKDDIAFLLKAEGREDLIK